MAFPYFEPVFIELIMKLIPIVNALIPTQPNRLPGFNFQHIPAKKLANSLAETDKTGFWQFCRNATGHYKARVSARDKAPYYRPIFRASN
jgi:hypothetical protein